MRNQGPSVNHTPINIFLLSHKYNNNNSSQTLQHWNSFRSLKSAGDRGAAALFLAISFPAPVVTTSLAAKRKRISSHSSAFVSYSRLISCRFCNNPSAVGLHVAINKPFFFLRMQIYVPFAWEGIPAFADKLSKTCGSLFANLRTKLLVIRF